MWLYFILCQLKFCTNPRKPTLIHDLIADMIEICGGSRQLIRILNRLGCATSPDTHDRFVAQHAIVQCQSKIWDKISSNTFTIASVDNFDMLQSYAAVYCGDQQRSYHGTTLQLVQPDPNSLMLLTSSTELTIAPAISYSGQRTSSDNAHTMGSKRPRTVQIQSLKSSLTTNSTVQQLQVHMGTTLAFNNFLQNSSKLNEKNNLHDQIFSYILQKHILHHQAHPYPANTSLSEFRLFLEDNNKCAQQYPSTVYYMELLNENPDCAETMSLVVENLLSKFDNVQDGWVVLVGDGKIYKHLINIKKQYSTALQKLLIFPGDWHILKNYQPILMKVHYAAGLRRSPEIQAIMGVH